MSGGALKLREVRKLADSRAAFEFELPVAELPDVPREFGAGDGKVQAQHGCGCGEEVTEGGATSQRTRQVHAKRLARTREVGLGSLHPTHAQERA